MANLSFNFDGQSYVSDVFGGGKVIQLAFPVERTRVLYVETRLGSTLPWKVIDSRILEKHLVVNIPFAGEGQEFRLNCIAEPTAAEIIPMKEAGGGGGGVEPGVPLPADTVDTDAIVDGAVEMQDLNQSVRDSMITKEDRVTTEELDNFNV
jgi:hypothetical protein